MLALTSLRFSTFVAALAIAAAFGFVAQAQAQSFSNMTQIAIPASSPTGVANPYGTSISVSGAPSRIKTFTVTIQNINHTFASDIRALLVAPSGQKVLLVSGAASNTSLVGQTWTFSNEATGTLPTAFGVPSISGTYRPTVVSGGALPAPAPGLPYTTDMSSLYGTNPNGTWTLYIADEFPSGAGGVIQGGWVLNIVGDMDTRFTYQGVLEVGSGPITGNANVRFSLFAAPFASLGEAALAGPTTKQFTNVERGLIRTELDFGNAILNSQSLWIETAAESPPGSGFVTLAPRQAITIAPQAGRALVANVADRAPWSGLTGVPARVASPYVAFSTSVPSFTPASYSTPIYNTIAQTSVSRTFPAGRVLVNWTISGFTNTANTAVTIRPRIGSLIGSPTTFFFSTPGQHMTISGTSLIENVPEGASNTFFEILRASGPDAFRVDTQDSFNATFLALPN
ncbi:MAG: hypothetical protein K2X32_01405 [Phycisphaerales bacterium]|nr:hypothetical protein [Phycisphaerales bacterium]